MARITSHEELEVYRLAFGAAMEIFDLTKMFPKEETYSLTDQIRRSSRAVCSNLAEAWRKRRYEAAFVNKLNDAEAEAAVPRLRLREAPPEGRDASRRPKHGCIFRRSAAIWEKRKWKNSARPTTTLSANSCA